MKNKKMGQIELFNENKCVWVNFGKRARLNQVWKYSCKPDNLFYGHIIKSGFKICPYCGRLLELKPCTDEKMLMDAYLIEVENNKSRG